MIAIEKNKKAKEINLKLSCGLEIPKELNIKIIDEEKENARKAKK